jgi:tetratricopeptide (TPR) repeat protein
VRLLLACLVFLSFGAGAQVDAAQKVGADTLESFTKIVGLLATVLGILGTLYAAWKYLSGKRRDRERVATLQAVGDRIADTADIEGEGYERAIAEYEKALALDGGNIAVFRRIISAARRKLELENPVRLHERECQAEINSALTRIYEFQAAHPGLKDDQELLLEEAALLTLSGKAESAVAALKKIEQLHPGNPDVLARLGFATDDADLVRRALEKRPGEASYHHVLGQVLERRGRKAEAIREHRRAADLPEGSSLESKRTRNYALRAILDVFKSVGGADERALCAELDMPVEERVEMLEYFVANRPDVRDAAPRFYLAALYRSRGELDKAYPWIREAVGEDRRSWRSYGYQPMVRLFETILREGGFDPATLAEVHEILQAHQERKQYEEVLETWREKGGHRYMVGLRVDHAPGPGVLVLRTYEGYPFAKAGVHEGDRILEFAHRKVATLRDMSFRLVEFTPGTDVPMKVQRAGELLDLTLIIQ